MSLLDRITRVDSTSPALNLHGFQAAMFEWSDGAIGFNRASIIAEFGLRPEDEAELDSLKSIYDSANTSAKKLRLQKAFDSIVMLAGDRDVSWYKTKATINARLNQAVS